jgi:hypothetical protein
LLHLDIRDGPDVTKIEQGDMKRLWSVSVFFMAALLCPQLKAGPVYPTCVTGSLESYINSSGCVLAGAPAVVYSGFNFPDPINPDGLTGLLDPTQITVTPEPSGLGGSFDFSGDFTVPALDMLTYGIDYFLLLDPAPVLGGGSLHLDPTGQVSVTESICADSFFGVSNGATVCQTNTPNGVVDSAPQSLTVNNSNPPASLSAMLILNPAAYNFASVETAIVLTGGPTTGATSGGVTVGNTVVDEAPEPVTSLLCLGGLIAIGIFRRRFIA